MDDIEKNFDEDLDVDDDDDEVGRREIGDAGAWVDLASSVRSTVL